MFQLHLSQNAQKFLDKLDNHISSRIILGLKKLMLNPIPSDAKFLYRDADNEKVFRVRIGDYRALYKVHQGNNVVLIAKIDKRPRVYDKNLI